MTTILLEQPLPELSRAASSAMRSEPKSSDREAMRQLLAGTGFFQNFEIEVALELLDDRMAKGEKSDYRFIFADENQHLAGFCCFGPIPVAPSRYDLYWIAVHPQLQKSGLGSKLLLASEQAMQAAGARIVYIETSSRAQYAPTQNFYLKNSYQEVARIPRYYADDDDRVIFMKPLQDRKNI